MRSEHVSPNPRSPILAPKIGQLLRGWREQRRLSQLELALQAEVSTRHLSFVETGRATPSRSMVLHLADALDIPLRERNQLLLAAGYAPVYGETALDSPAMRNVRTTVRHLLDAHEPNPAVVVDRYWNIIEANAGATLFTEGLPEFLRTPTVNVMRVSLHPEGAARSIVNFAEWRAYLLGRLRREVAHSQDAALAALYAEVRAYEHAAAHDDDDDMEPLAATPDREVVIPLRYQLGDTELTFLSTVAVFGTPHDITVAELAIELFFPADSATAAVLRDRHSAQAILSIEP